jgi:hypothetical protein
LLLEGLRMLRRPLFTLLATLGIAAYAAERIDVTVSGTLKAGVVAIGGETTGVTITADGITWELQLRGKQLEAAGDLNGRNAVVTGRLVRRKGVELPDRYVVEVRSISAGTARGPRKSR